MALQFHVCFTLTVKYFHMINQLKLANNLLMCLISCGKIIDTLVVNGHMHQLHYLDHNIELMFKRDLKIVLIDYVKYDSTYC